MTINANSQNTTTARINHHSILLMLVAALIIIWVGLGIVLVYQWWQAQNTLQFDRGTPLPQLIPAKIKWTPMTGFTIYVNNTGYTSVSVSQVLVNYASQVVTSPSALPVTIKTGTTQAFAVTFTYTNGTNYDITVVTSDGYEFTNTFQGGTNAG